MTILWKYHIYAVIIAQVQKTEAVKCTEINNSCDKCH